MKKEISEKEIEELARIKRNEYQKRWREENKDKVREYQRNYWERQALKEIKAEGKQ